MPTSTSADLLLTEIIDSLSVSQVPLAKAQHRQSKIQSVSDSRVVWKGRYMRFIYPSSCQELLASSRHDPTDAISPDGFP